MRFFALDNEPDALELDAPRRAPAAARPTTSSGSAPSTTPRRSRRRIRRRWSSGPCPGAGARTSGRRLDGCGDGGPDLAAHGGIALPRVVPAAGRTTTRRPTACASSTSSTSTTTRRPAGVALSDDESAATAALRLRSLKSLYDPTYVDESWIGPAAGAALDPAAEGLDRRALPGHEARDHRVQLGRRRRHELARSRRPRRSRSSGAKASTSRRAGSRRRRDSGRGRVPPLPRLRRRRLDRRRATACARVSANVDDVGAYAVARRPARGSSSCSSTRTRRRRDAAVSLRRSPLHWRARLFRFDGANALGPAGTLLPSARRRSTLTLPARSATLAVTLLDFADVPSTHPLLRLRHEGRRRRRLGRLRRRRASAPTRPVTRAQMAVFLLKAKLGSALRAARRDGDGVRRRARRRRSPPPGSRSSPRSVSRAAAAAATTARTRPGHPRADGRVPAEDVARLGYAPPAAHGIFGDVPPSGRSPPTGSRTSTPRNITGGCSASPLLYCPGNAEHARADGGVSDQDLLAPVELTAACSDLTPGQVFVDPKGRPRDTPISQFNSRIPGQGRQEAGVAAASFHPDMQSPGPALTVAFLAGGSSRPLRCRHELQAAGLFGVGRLHRPDEPRRSCVSSPDGRVLVAEKSGLIKIFPNLTTNTYTVVGRPAHGGPQLLGPRAARPARSIPNFATNNYIYVLYSYDAVIGGTPPNWGMAGQTSDACPTPPGATTDGCVISSRLSRLTAIGDGLDGRARGAARTTGASSSRATRPARSISARTATSTSAAATAPASTTPTGASSAAARAARRPRQPLRRPALPRRHAADASPPPRAARCAARVRAGRRRAAPAERLDPARSIRPRALAAPGQPAHRLGRRQRAAHHRLRPAQSVPHDRPPRHERGLDRATSAGTRWEELNRIPDLSTRPQLRLALLRGQRRPVHGPEHLPAQAADDARPFYLQAQRLGRRGRRLLDGQLLGRRHGLLPGRQQLPLELQERALLLGLLAQVHVGHVPRRQRQPDPATTAAFASTRRRARGPADRARRQPLLRRLRRRPDHAGQVRPGRRRRPPARPRATRP